MISFIYRILKKKTSPHPPQNTHQSDEENRLVVARGKGWAMDEMGEGGHKVHISSHKRNKA